MYQGNTIGVVVPAYNEEKLIARTITSMPDFIDHIVVVDDGSQDRTSHVVAELQQQDPRVVLLHHEQNRGVGAAISTGYIWCRDDEIDVAVVMAGDGQMDPADLPRLIDPVVEDRTDYAKGDRLRRGEIWERKNIPYLRYFGNSVLTFLTKIASGYWHVTDSQTGYTAISKKALQEIPLERIYPRYGMPNDLLVTLNIYGMRVVDIPVNPVYDIGEESGIKISRIIFSLPLLLLRLFCKRMWQKYVIRDFHPLVFFYALGAVMLAAALPLVVRLLVIWSCTGIIPSINALAIMFCCFMGSQSLLFAMLFDMEANSDLKGG